jgi:hypothetical protein
MEGRADFVRRRVTAMNSRGPQFVSLQGNCVSVGLADNRRPALLGFGISGLRRL